ncbi:shikimate kinase, partial [Acinetobacter baumannii]
MVDTDQILQNRFGRPISTIFKLYGEEAFRGHETSVLKELSPDNAVISTGGGIVLREENWHELRRLGTILYLRASADTLKKRLHYSKRKRPL